MVSQRYSLQTYVLFRHRLSNIGWGGGGIAILDSHDKIWAVPAEPHGKDKILTRTGHITKQLFVPDVFALLSLPLFGSIYGVK